MRKIINILWILLFFCNISNLRAEGNFRISVKPENNAANCVYKIFNKIIDCKLAGEYEFIASSDKMLDTIYYKGDNMKEFQIYTLCKFRANETYGIFYNPCDGEFKIYVQNQIDKEGNSKIKFLVTNYFEKNKLEAEMMCTNFDINLKPVILKNNILSKPLLLDRSCLGGMCGGGVVNFYLLKKIDKKVSKSDEGNFSSGVFLPLHQKKEILIFEYDFVSKETKFYLE